ncbi:MAG: hypothetical protein EAZ70_08805 [Runella slithyformis]|nr:MAG: hypothetical protein EAY79_09575 [Runella slithyformis]TAF94412.1 MAG: hypothetical protein EAZ46_10420 [Runella sp.]TAG18141.1 MAG: hypothetical protein EAZ38_15715 [Cytophagales bacterium]TAG37688.1 MAG: hypothetical protein EAZ32_14620 [Cytophagia bacterium]TAF26356.1 MAG: hypothetical protein EAZ70_08805 [Runella slithyformis]
MKKLLLGTALCLMANMANAQVDEVMLKMKQKEKKSSDEAIVDVKKMAKSQTWLDRGKLYDEIARTYVSLDSSASLVAYDSFKKAIEVDAAKPSKVTKDAQKYLTGGGNDENVNLHASLVTNGAQKFQGKSYEKALKFFMLAQEVRPQDTLAPLYGAYSAMQMQKNDVAAGQMEKYISSGGKDPSNFTLLAQVYRIAKDNESALKVLEKGMTVVPMSKSMFKSERVNVLIDAGRTDEALVTLAELIELEPKNVQYALNTGILHDNAANQFGGEIRKLKDAAKRGGNDERKLKDAEDTDKVYIDELKRIGDGIKKQPKNADLKRQKTETEARQKENKATIAELKEKVAKDKEELAKLGDVDAKIADLITKRNEKLTLARTAYNKALAIDPKNYDALFNVGVFYFNEAVEMKGIVDGMDMKDYNARGKDIEIKVCGKFKQAQSFFLKAKESKEEDMLTENLKMLENIFKEFEGKKIVCEEAK